MQKAVLFKGSIRNNMQVAKQDATDGEIDEALAIAQAKEFVDKKDGRLDYMIRAGWKESFRWPEAETYNSKSSC